MSEEGKECCGKAAVTHCDFRYRAAGPATDIFYDFMRDENIWLRKYHEAWTIATENGHPGDALQWLDADEGPSRHELKGDAARKCFEDQDCNQDSNKGSGLSSKITDKGFSEKKKAFKKA
jgi:hypothetical protein